MRLRVAALDQDLARHGLPLSEDQQHALILVLHEAGIELQEYLNFVEFKELEDTPISISNAEPRTRLEAIAWWHQRILEQANPILTPEQMDVFAAFAASQRALREATLRQDQR